MRGHTTGLELSSTNCFHRGRLGFTWISNTFTQKRVIGLSGQKKKNDLANAGQKGAGRMSGGETLCVLAYRSVSYFGGKPHLYAKKKPMQC